MKRQTRIGLATGSVALTMGLASCATDQVTTLANDQGQTVTCKKDDSYKDCVAKAKASGFKETEAAKPVPSIPY
jgi:hypothetical protein